jgi:hypothetical protein
VSQNFDDYGQIIPRPNADRRDNFGSPGYDNDPAIPSAIFDEYGEVIALPVGPGQNQPGPVARVAPPIPHRQTNPVPVQPQPRPTTPVVVPTVPIQPQVIEHQGGSKVGAWFLLMLGIVILVLAGLVVWQLISSRPGGTTNQAQSGNFTPGFPLNVAGRILALNTELDRLYTQGNTALARRQFREAATSLEQLRDRQEQTTFNKYRDVPVLLFRTYLELGEELWKSTSLNDFQEGLTYLKKASQLTKSLESKDRNQQEEAALQARIDNGTSYEQAVIAYNQQLWEGAVTGFGAIYARDQNFRNASSLFYDSLVKVGDARLAANQLPEAYLHYARAARLKNVTDTRYAQARTTSTESQLRQAGKPIPTLPAS